MQQAVEVLRERVPATHGRIRMTSPLPSSRHDAIHAGRANGEGGPRQFPNIIRAVRAQSHGGGDSISGAAVRPRRQYRQRRYLAQF